MAKQLVSPIERHIEKGVLAIAGLALLGVVAKYIVTSPNQIDLGSEVATPNNADELVARKADAVRDAISRATDTEETPEPLSDVFREALDAFESGGVSVDLPTAVPIGPEVPVIDKTPARVGERTLVDVAKLEPDKPVVTHGRSTLLLNPDAPAGSGAMPTNWATVSAVFNVREQMEKQQLQYGPKRDEVVFGPVQLERRARRTDGSWSDEDFERVNTWPAGSTGPVPPVVLTTEDGVWVADRTNRLVVERFFDALKTKERQLHLLRPLMPEFRDGDPWALPIITNQRDVVIMDCEYLFPGQPLEECTDNRYEEVESLTRDDTVDLDDTGPTNASLLEDGERAFQKARNNCDYEGALEVRNLAYEFEDDVTASRTERSKAKRLFDKAENLMADISRNICKPQGGRDDADTGAKERQKLPKQQLLAHDSRTGSLISGRTYQYRIRATIFNRLAGEPSTFADHRDSQVVFIEGPWSEPSDPVVVDPDTFTFVTSSDSKKENVSVEVYKWFEGVWVKQRAKCGVGEPVSVQKRHAVPSLEDPEGSDTPLIDFDASQTVVDIDFQRAHRARNRGSKRGGAGFDRLEPGCSVVFMDADGELHERFVTTDKAHPGKSVVAAKVYKPR